MKITSHSDVAHCWANQLKDHGKSGNMFFINGKIYSYGMHFLIAEFITPDIIFFTTRNYSNSTAKHKSIVRMSCTHKTVFEVPSIPSCPKYGSHSIDFCHKNNIEYFKNEIKNAKYDLMHSRALNTINSRLSFLNYKISNYNQYVTYFNLDEKIITFESIVNEKERFNLAEKRKRYQKIYDLKEQKRIEKEKENLEKWKNDINFRYYFNLEKAYLRVNGDFIESTKYSKAPVNECKLLYKVLKSNKPVHGLKLSEFTVTSFSDGILKIGCHTIDIEEIERIAKILNW